MRILFIDIDREGVRIPFTEKRIPLYLAITPLILFLGLRKTSAEKVTCALPQGDFTNSCTDIAIKPYRSIDPFVPQTCVLTANCPTMFAGLPPEPNEIFLPADLTFEGVTNRNGTLTYRGKSFNKKVVTAETTVEDSDQCLPPEGSYHKSCNTEKSRYTSSDPRLASSDLCKAKAVCRTLDGTSTTSMVFFNIKSQKAGHSMQRLENCDGALVLGTNDRQCQTSFTSEIRRIAEASGRRPSLSL